MEGKPTKIVYGINIEHQENKYDIHDFNISGGNFFLSDALKKAVDKNSQKGTADELDADLVEKLLPAFRQNREEATSFLNYARVAEPKQITKRVTQLVEDGVIDKRDAKSHLWKILHDAEIYASSRQNWDTQVKIKY